MALSTNNSNAVGSDSFLTKLSTLREFVRGMGVTSSENELSHALRNSGYNVELALERLLSGCFKDVGDSNGNVAAISTPSSARKRAATTNSNINTLSSSATKSNSTQSIKRPRISNIHKSNTSFKSPSAGRAQYSSGQSPAPNNIKHEKNNGMLPGKLLLCKRWTIACSKSIHGRVNHGELLDFSENWKNNGKSTNDKTTNGLTNKKQNKQQKKVIDPMVRFRSHSGRVEGSLNKYLCSLLAPLLKIPATSNSNGGTHAIGGGINNPFIPMIYLEGEALMEDRHLVIGSEVPLSLKIYLNDPIGFFELFQFSSESGGKGGESKLFFRKDDGGKSLPWQGKSKLKNNFSEAELAQAAYHLLQWAEKGEEIVFTEVNGNAMLDNEKSEMVEKNIGTMKPMAGKKEADDDIDDASDSSATVNVSKNGDDEDDELSNLDIMNEEDFNENVDAAEREGVKELNQLVVADRKVTNEKALPELSDPIGFRSPVVLRPYQRQALYWMCRREGCNAANDANNEGEELDSTDEELDLLSELAASSHSANSCSTDAIQVWGGKAIACDCGPVVVGDDSVASNAIPLAEYQGEDVDMRDEKRKYVHHPLWKRRFLATESLGSVYSFYVNELLGIASATPPNPPKQCVGGILADAMGLGKTVMLLSLILKSKEAGEKEAGASVGDEKVADTVTFKEIEMDAGKLSDETENCANKSERVTRASSNPSKDTVSCGLSGNNPRGTTLVIAPLSLITQWEEEIASKTDLTHFVCYDVSAKKLSGNNSFSCVDVVVTTYGTIQSEFISLSRSNKLNGSSKTPGDNHPLLSFDWKRIILDEAHGIKNPATVVSRACCMIKAESRWCVTGTPIQNSLQDVYGLLKFLRHEPWCEAGFWRNAITNTMPGISIGSGNAKGIASENNASIESPCKAGTESADAMNIAFGRVRRVLAPIILRRTKETLTEDGTPILTLPPIESSIVNVILSPPEREFYSALLQRSQSVFDGFLNSGTASKSWFAIFSLLQRLRQACDHVSLTVQKRLENINMGDGNDETNQDDSFVTSFSSDGGDSDVNGKFLGDLLKKFKKNAVNSNSSVPTNKNSEESLSFVRQVAESLSQCVSSSDEYLKSECPICFEEPKLEDAVHTPCAHMFCRMCIISEFEEQQNRIKKNVASVSMFKKTPSSGQPNSIDGGDCPVCHSYVKISRVIQIEKTESGEMVSKYLQPGGAKKESVTLTAATERDVAAREALASALNGASSSKLEAVIAELNKIWELDPGSKVLIFSQYLGFLDIVDGFLTRQGITSFRIDGKMSLKERVTMIDNFNRYTPETRIGTSDGDKRHHGSVFLLSMKAGGVGLNLVAASSVFIIDPWWNAAVEDQCVNRIHRIGQQAAVVRVRKFVVTDSVEERIVKLQEKKKGMANEILSDVDTEGQMGNSKPTLEDFKLIFGR